MSVTFQHDEDANTYSIGAEVEGVFVPFASVDGATVQGRIASQRAIDQANQAAGGGRAPTPGAAAGAAVNAADFTENGDGTYTRKSDGAQGRFTPTGFEPVTTP